MRIKFPRWIILFILFTLWVVIVLRFERNKLWDLLLFAPLFEELVFRWALLELTLRNDYLRKMKWKVIVIFSFIFGMIHMHQNMFLIQGVACFMFSYLYIYYRDKYTSAFIATIIMIVLHSLWNLFSRFGLHYLI